MPAVIGATTPSPTRQPAFDSAPIRVNRIAPGVVATDFRSGMGKEQAEAYLKDHENKMLTQKVAQPEDVAEAFLYVMRGMNTTGQVVHTNSGVFLI
jgi:NAD(P)-dependent dehydrogenase (short-subunit alcohol dehydrogenase family)